MRNTQDQIKKLEEEVHRLKVQAEQYTLFQAEKDRLDNEFQRSQERFRTIFEESAVGKKIIDDQLHIIKVNKALLNILGYTENEMLGKVITDFSHPDFVKPWKDLQHQLWTTSMSSFNFDTCLIKKDRSTVWVHVTTILIEDTDDTLGYTIIEDISERIEIERLKDLIREQEQRQEIAETILNTQEEERRRVAESLHNGLGQLLYGVKLSLNDVKVRYSESQPGNERALQYTQQLITDCIHECRRISHDLMPAMLQEHGLKEAVEDICRQLTNGLSFESNIQGLDTRIDNVLEIAIYRMIQELAMNIVKHAEASRAAIDIAADEAAIYIQVRDNGKGFDEEGEQQKKGIGLQTVRYKVNLLSGTLNVSSAKGKGTTVEITIPRRIA
ncbi:PAS domain-containing sensor histidine kinase [Mucilaginibacter panaciglaebae]|uniref:Oxygen sensor histidine kinase NreB n=1 Tax=Mucilaginibacter panaciglaebae TaxID=502331 RepID=A0ABP7WBL8_9SPHI